MDGILYAVGGHDGPLVRRSVESYNPETRTWSPVADMALCRRNAGKRLTDDSFNLSIFYMMVIFNLYKHIYI